MATLRIHFWVHYQFDIHPMVFHLYRLIEEEFAPTITHIQRRLFWWRWLAKRCAPPPLKSCSKCLWKWEYLWSFHGTQQPNKPCNIVSNLHVRFTKASFVQALHVCGLRIHRKPGKSSSNWWLGLALFPGTQDLGTSQNMLVCMNIWAEYSE